VPGVRLVGRYGANAEHTLYYLVETDDWQALHRFLLPGFKRATCTITPVSEEPVQH
jgi:muconolactone delta-isomerase